jgi:hypothetical protein
MKPRNVGWHYAAVARTHAGTKTFVILTKHVLDPLGRWREIARTPGAE